MTTLAPSASGTERILLITDEHWITYVTPIIMACIVGGAGILLYLLAGYTAFYNMWLSHLSLLGGLFILLLSHHWLFHRVLSKCADQTIVTNERVIDTRVSLLIDEGLFEIQLSKIKSIHAMRRNILQAILNYGDLKFDPAGTINDIPHPQNVARIIENAIGLV